MRHSAIEFAQQIDRRWQDGERWDVLLTTDMCNVAELKGLIRTPARECPVLCYFHENQFAYPNQHPRDRDEHFLFTNVVSALAADQCWFNSEFNRHSLLTAIEERCQRWPDFPPQGAGEQILARSSIMPPPVATPPTDHESLPSNVVDPLRLVWAARWEHDKNPAGLLEILRALRAADISFSVDVIGPTFRENPPEFKIIEQEFSAAIGAWGYLETREQYWQTLSRGDCILSTADHEFYGLSVVEALCCGLQAILPNRLSYPEISQNLGAAVHLYDNVDGAVRHIRQATADLSRLRDTGLRRQNADQAIRRFGWKFRLSQMEQGIEQLSADSVPSDL